MSKFSKFKQAVNAVLELAERGDIAVDFFEDRSRVSNEGLWAYTVPENWNGEYYCYLCTKNVADEDEAFRAGVHEALEILYHPAWSIRVSEDYDEARRQEYENEHEKAMQAIEKVITKLLSVQKRSGSSKA